VTGGTCAGPAAIFLADCNMATGAGVVTYRFGCCSSTGRRCRCRMCWPWRAATQTVDFEKPWQLQRNRAQVSLIPPEKAATLTA
jgi:hypothetical protein